MAPVIGGKGGGSKMAAQASGADIDKLSEAVEAAKLFATTRVKWQRPINIQLGQLLLLILSCNDSNEF